jgi:hypothetical protein
MNVEDIVRELNEAIYERFTNTEDSKILDGIPPLVEFRSDGFTYGVEFLGVYIWDSDMDDRPYSEEDPEEKIPLIEHLRKEINKYCTLFGKIHLPEIWRVH